MYSTSIYKNVSTRASKYPETFGTTSKLGLSRKKTTFFTVLGIPVISLEIFDMS